MTPIQTTTMSEGVTPLIAPNEKNSPGSDTPSGDEPQATSQQSPAAKMMIPSADPLQSIKALSEEERLALFT